MAADHGEIEQAIVNLAVNSRDAMPGGGRLTLETRNVELDEAYTRQHVDVRPSAHVALSVSDTGTGMDEATRARIFDALLHDEGSRQGNGAGPRHCVRHNQAKRRTHRRREQGRTGENLPDLPSEDRGGKVDTGRSQARSLGPGE